MDSRIVAKFGENQPLVKVTEKSFHIVNK